MQLIHLKYFKPAAVAAIDTEDMEHYYLEELEDLFKSNQPEPDSLDFLANMEQSECEDDNEQEWLPSHYYLHMDLIHIKDKTSILISQVDIYETIQRLLVLVLLFAQLKVFSYNIPIIMLETYTLYMLYMLW